MSEFFNNVKRVIVRSLNSTPVLQVAQPTTLRFYIVERVSFSTLASVEYKIELQNGRSTSELIPWTATTPDPLNQSIYTFDVTLVGVTESSNLLITFKVVDTDGNEFFITSKDLSVIL